MPIKIHPHIRAALERARGLPLEAFPASGIELRVSDARTDEPGNLLLAHRIPGCDGALATAIPRIAEAVRPVLSAMSSAELFSPLGVAELRRALSPEDGRAILEAPGLDYAVTDPADFRPAAAGHRTVLLMAADIRAAREEFGLEMSERDADPPEGLAWAFVEEKGTGYFFGFILGLPGGRTVDSRPSSSATRRTHCCDPNGRMGEQPGSLRPYDPRHEAIPPEGPPSCNDKVLHPGLAAKAARTRGYERLAR